MVDEGLNTECGFNILYLIMNTHSFRHGHPTKVTGEIDERAYQVGRLNAGIYSKGWIL